MSTISGKSGFWDTMLRGFAMGLAIGTGIGVIEGNLVMWMAVGTVCGIALGFGWNHREQQGY